MQRQAFVKTLALAATLAAWPLVSTAADAYPSRTITIIVPAPPGGAIDMIARVVGEKMAASMGQLVVIDNKPGASNEPIVYTHEVPLVFAIYPQIPAKTLPEFTAWMKANPVQAKVATSGRGSAQEMAAEMYKVASGVEMLLVPYKGSSAAQPDLIGGRTALFIDTISAIQAQVKSGNVRAVAVSTDKRSAALPDVPTAAEQGLKGYDANTNGGMLAPAGTPKAIVARLNTEINAALKMSDVRAKLEAAGIEVQGGMPQDYAALIKSDLAKWNKVIQAAGIKAE